MQSFTIPPCCGVGLPAGYIAISPGELLPHRFTLACGIKPIGGLVSVALSLVLRRQPVRLTPALLQPGLSSGFPALPRCAFILLYQIFINFLTLEY